jgi:putative Mg2+ transporter-C (MgtC) family protein
LFTATVIHQLVIPLLAAFSCGFLLGMERELSHKPAGLRTQVLITLGSTIFVIASLLYGQEPVRISANVVTGLGFLGAGVVLKEKGSIRGMTTASLIWVNGSLGLAIGLGEYLLAACGVLLVLFTLRVLGGLEGYMKSKCRVVHYRVRTAESEQPLRLIQDALDHCHIQEQPMTFNRTGDSLDLRFAFCNPPQRHEAFVLQLQQLPEVIAVEIEA